MKWFNRKTEVVEYPQIVTKIHNEFNTAAEKTLQNALSILDEVAKQDKGKGELLVKLGFTNTPEAKHTSELETKEMLAREQSELIRYYKDKYPFNKFISEESVKTICVKYSLVCGDVSLFKGFVPKRNLEAIERFELKEKYEVMVIDRFGEIVGYASKNDIVNGYIKRNFDDSSDFFVEYPGGEINLVGGNKKYGEFAKFVKFTGKLMLKICAPLKDMDVTGKELRGYKIVNHPDPVVLQPVKGGYLIVTAWGDESKDELVMNDKLN